MKILLIIFFVFSVIFLNAHIAQGGSSTKTYVLVHGAWGGGWDYRQMEEIIEKSGHRFYRPTLTGQGEREHLNGPDVNLDTHIMDVLNVIKFEDLSDVILIGHSYGGMVITGVADKIPDKVNHLVYVDALLPNNGESVFSLNTEESRKNLTGLAKEKGNGYSIPPTWPDWGKDVPHPLATFQQPIKLENPELKNIPATYVLTIDPGAKTDSFSKYAKRAKEKGYQYYEWRTGHNPQRTMLNEYAEFLLKLGN